MSQFRYSVAANHKNGMLLQTYWNTSELSLIFEGGENEKGGSDILKSTKHYLRYMYNLDIQSLQKAAPTNKYTINLSYYLSMFHDLQDFLDNE